MRCEEFYDKWKKCGNFCEKHPDTARKIDQYLDLVAELEVRGIPTDQTFGALPEGAARPLISIRDEQIRQNAISHIENALNRKTPNGGNYNQKFTSSDVEEIVKTESEKIKSPLLSSESVEWYTPPEIVSAVLEVFGEIDLDPCSPSNDGPIPAKTRFTRIDDGLSCKWDGRTYMNPPYGPDVRLWVEKCLKEYLEGDVTEAIVLVAARTDTKWFNLINDYPWCAIEGRLTFSGSKNRATFPSAVFYIGENVKSFYSAFSSFGPIFHKLYLEDVDYS